MTEPIPEDIAGFLGSNIESIDQLEILRVLGDDPAREWTVSALAAVIQAPPRDMPAHVTALRARGLLAFETRGTDLVCRYKTATPELETILTRVLQCYRERPVTMIKLVYAQAADPLRAFADAFRLRKKED